MSSSGLVKRRTLLVSGEARPSVAIAPAVSTPTASSAVAAKSVSETPVVSQAEIDQIKAAARAEGLAAGHRQGQQEVEKAAREKLAAVDALLKSVTDAWHDERERMHAALADFAFIAANRMLGDALSDPHSAVAAVRSALGACNAWQDLTIEVNSRDLDLLRQALDNDVSLAEKNVRVVASSAVRVGGCRVSSSEGTLDARLEVQLAELRARLDAEQAAQKAMT
jgi:flagellar biosynthesis/type III secretory pathway protein FliH